MKKSFKVEVNPKVIKWARKSANFSEEETAKKLKVSLEDYKKIETGEEKPTFKQLEQLARLFKRPIAVLLLPELPKTKDSRFLRLLEVEKELKPEKLK